MTYGRCGPLRDLSSQSPALQGHAAISCESVTKAERTSTKQGGEKAGHGQKPLYGQLGLPYFFRDLLANQYSWSHRSGYHQQLSGEFDCRGISGFCFLHRLRSDVHPRRFFGGTIHRKTRDGAGLLGWHAGLAEFRSIPWIPRSSCFLLHYRSRDGRSAGGHQSLIACCRRGRTLCVQFDFGPIGVWQRIIY